MGEQSLLAGDDEVGRHGEEPVRPRLLGEFRVPDGERRAVAGTGDDGHPAAGLLDGRTDDEPELLGVQRVELARAAAGEDGRGTGVDTRAHVRAEGVEVDGAVRPVGGDGEEERPGDGGESGGKGAEVTGAP